MDEEKDYKIMIEGLAKIASTPAGHAFIWHVLSICNMYSDCYTGNQDTYYMLGQKSVGLAILEMLNEADPELYPRMLLKATKQDIEVTENDGNDDSNG